MPPGYGCRTYVVMRAALKLSRAVADLLRTKRKELGLSLRQVQEKTAEAGQLVPFPTLARVEQGKVDPGVRRLHLLLKLYQVPPQLVSDLIELEEFAGKLPKSQDPRKLYEKGLALWKSGETGQGIACLIALQKLFKDVPAEKPLRQRAIVSFAVMAGSLGKYHLSLDLLGRLFLEPPEPSLLVSALVQAGQCWNQLGSGEVALAFLERAEKHVAVDDHKGRAWVLHLKASTLAKLGQYEEAATILRQAIALYKKAGDAYGESTALAARSRILVKQGDAHGALNATREARRHAKQHGFTRLVSMRMIDEGHALVLLGEAAKAVSVLREALGGAVTEGDRHAEFHAHHCLWNAYSTLGEKDQATFELAAARNCVRFVDETSEEAEEVRSMALQEPRPRRGRPPGTRRADQS